MSIQSPKNVAGAFDRISSHTKQTPLVTSSVLNNCLGHELVFKTESLQKTAPDSYHIDTSDTDHEMSSGHH